MVPGFTVTDVNTGIVTISVADCIPFPVAVIWIPPLPPTANVLTGKFTDVAPGGTVTDAGTDTTSALLLARFTVSPPAGAAPLRVTVPVLVLPPTTDAGCSVSDAMIGSGLALNTRSTQ